MRATHASLNPNVPADTLLWRYLDFPKFISMLKDRALWFSRADLLGDPLEGSFTQARAIERQRLLENPPEGRTREDLESVLRHNTKFFSKHRLMVYINCWHSGNHESMALWRGYGGGPFAIAVRTNFGLLDTMLPQKFRGSSAVSDGAVAPDDAGPPQAMPIYLTKVRYIDHSSTTERFKDENNLFTPFSFKSRSYSHENEVRAVYWNIPGFDPHTAQQINPDGFLVPVDVTRLITAVVVSPLAPAWFAPLVRDTCHRYDFPCEVAASETSHDAVF
jgi:hypothetical protein